MRVLFATSEAAPLVKTGGLADVSAALPAALCEFGIDARLLLPGYPSVLDGLRLHCVRRELELLPGVRAGRLLRGRMPATGVPVFVLDIPSLYQRGGGPYLDPTGRDWPDNHLRFGALSRLAALMGSRGSPTWRPHIVQCNDWQTGLAAAYLAHAGDRVAAAVMAVHNLSFPGRFAPDTLPALGLPWSSFSMHGLELHGDISFLKAGLYYAERLITVSPTYAEEIQTVEFGGGLHGLLHTRRDVLTGIQNGIDTRTWDPASDPHLWQRYSAQSLDRKHANRRALQQAFGLPPEPASLLLGMVSRLSHQKGIDLVIAALRRLRAAAVQLVIQGGGDRHLEAELAALRRDLPTQVGVRFGYDEQVAHRIEGGADAFLMPSRFEPCGLNQMYSMRYGTPPIVRRTGGLADSVVDAGDGTRLDPRATGFVFDRPSADDLEAAIRRAMSLHAAPAGWRELQRAGMAQDFSWRHSAEQYRTVYESVL